MLKADLMRITKAYWEMRKAPIDKILTYYICESVLNNQSLLEAELDYARKTNNIKLSECKTLVLLVGLSLDPLLQTISVCKPKKIILILNQEGYPVLGQDGKYDTEAPHEFAKHMVSAVRHLKGRGLIDEMPTYLPDNSTVGFPTDENGAFKTLVEALHNEDHAHVVIDITGGKKSMVTSAFLYAAFSGARISYVDFGSYSINNRRPYGFSCKIGELANPYQDFSLREWEKARVLYNRYQFSEALQLLTDIEISMAELLHDSKESIKKLIHFIRFYDKWDSGDFRNAKLMAIELQQKIGFNNELRLPSVVCTFGGGDDWYHFEGDDMTSKPEPIYGDLTKLVVYVYDEIERIKRLIRYNEDYRSAFLRAGGVSEIIMLGRLLLLVEDSHDRILLLNKLAGRTPNAKSMFDAFSKHDRQVIKIGYKGEISFPGFCKKDDPQITVAIKKPMHYWWLSTKMFKDEVKDKQDKGYDVFLDMRNEVAHKYFPVPKKWAEEGLKFIQANFDDFMKNHMEEQEPDDYRNKCCTNALPWSELCVICDADTFLTPNLRRDE